MNIDPVVQAASVALDALVKECDRNARAAILRAFAANAEPLSMAAACYLAKAEFCYTRPFGSHLDSGTRESFARRVFRSMCEDRTLGHVGWSAGGDYAYRPASDAAWSSRITGQIEGQC